MMENLLTRAATLMQLGRFDDAEPILRQVIAGNPNDAHGHALLGQCHLARGQLAEATEEAEKAVGLAPDFDFPFYVLASTWRKRGYNDRAMTAIGEAIRIDPRDPDYYAFRSALHLDASQWRESLSAAETGLAIDAQHVQCNNLRAMALQKLGRSAEAGATLDATLAREPENSWTHANKGWSLLEARRTDEALKHFRESLRLDPTNDYARAGLVEALKGRHFIYGLFLRYMLWMAKLPPRTQMGLVIGGFIAYQVVRNIAFNNPGLAPYLNPLLYAYLAFVWFTWVAQPVFDLLLRLHPIGRHALSNDQRRESNWFGLCVVTALVLFGLSFLGGALAPLDEVAILVAILALPLRLVFQCEPGRPRRIMTAGVTALAAMLAVAVGAMYAGNGALAGKLADFYWIGVVVAVWGGQGLTMVTPRR
jgi:tetratricopeptide (TPR) repeat protein